MASAQGLTCAGTAVTPLVRAEGLAERLGDVVLECSGGAPGAVIKENLTVFLSVNNTNQLLTNGVLDAQLTVDTGAGPVPSVSPRPAGPSALAFNGVEFTLPASGKVALRITNLRGDVSQANTAPITAAFSISGNGPTTNSNRFVVGIAQPALLAQYANAAVNCSGSLVPPILNIANLLAAGTRFSSARVTEGFASAFQSLAQDPLADTGTRIMLRYSGFPAGARLFVPDFVAGSSAVTPTAGGDLGVAASGGQYTPGSTGSLLLVRIIGADENGAGGAPALPTPFIATSFNSVSEVALAAGAGNALYEVVDANPVIRESAQIPTFLSLTAPGFTGNTSAEESISLAPLSNVHVAANAPIPRFADVPPASDCPALGDCDADYLPHLFIDRSSVSFNGYVNGPAPTQYVRVRNEGGGLMEWTARIIFENGAGWLETYPSSAVNNRTLMLRARPDKVAAGTYNATVFVDAGPFVGSRGIPITMNVTEVAGQQTTGPNVTAVVNAANFEAGPLVAGSLAAVTGWNLAGSQVSVTFDTVPAKVFSAAPASIRLQVPLQIAGKTSSKAVVTVDGRSSTPQSVSLAMVAPAIFPNGVVNQDNTVNSVMHPARAGSVIQIFATGLASPGSGPVTASIHDRAGLVPQASGAAFGMTGVERVGILIPADLPAGATELKICAVGTDPNHPVCSAPAKVVVSK